MITPDFIHPLIGFPAALASLLLYFALGVRTAVRGPADISTLDHIDGLDSRTD